MLIESSMLAADKPPDPELRQRNARRLIAMSRGLQVLISGVMLAILGLLLADPSSSIHSRTAPDQALA